jgi:hypothetical protein
VVEFGFKGGTLEDPAVVAVRPTLVVRWYNSAPIWVGSDGRLVWWLVVGCGDHGIMNDKVEDWQQEGGDSRCRLGTWWWKRWKGGEEGRLEKRK